MEIDNKDNKNLINQYDDLIEDKYSYSIPKKEVTEQIVKSLVERIVKEEIINTEIQYELLECMYKWSWFPCSEEYYEPLLNTLERITHPSNLVVALKIFVNSGKAIYLDLFQTYENNENCFIRDIAKEGINHISSNE